MAISDYLAKLKGKRVLLDPDPAGLLYILYRGGEGADQVLDVEDDCVVIENKDDGYKLVVPFTAIGSIKVEYPPAKG